MKRDPSDRGGLRTGSTSETHDDVRDPNGRPASTRHGLGGLLVVLAVFIGFGVGSRLGAEESAGSVQHAVFDVPHVGAGVDAARSAADGARAGTGGIPIDELPVYRSAAVRIEPARLPQSEPIALEPTSRRERSNAPASLADPLNLEAAQDLAERFTIVTHGEIASGESLGTSLRRQGISPSTVYLIATEMRKVFDFRKSRPGDRYRLGQDQDGRVLDFRYAQSEEESFYLAWEGTRYVVRKETAELRPLIAKIEGVVSSSFYGAVLNLGEQSALASEFARILAWDIDFSRQVHPGDEFQILYERLYRTDDDGEDVYVRPGRVLAGRYVGKGGEHTFVYFEDERGQGAYFRPDGTSVERAFLAAPLEFSRITSRFTRARRHPILNVTRPHPGIDYAAPHGTPIWSVADGVVEYRARAGASGNLIRIRHKGGMTSHYAHLASFADGLKVGDRVEQKQIIGYVGSTGLSTGPHVCFRVKQDGTYVDPMKISGPAGAPVAKSRLVMFQSVRDQLLADLGDGVLAVADEAFASTDEAL